MLASQRTPPRNDFMNAQDVRLFRWTRRLDGASCMADAALPVSCTQRAAAESPLACCPLQPEHCWEVA